MDEKMKARQWDDLQEKLEEGKVRLWEVPGDEKVPLCLDCVSEEFTTCPRDIDAICVICGRGFCGAHIGPHLQGHFVTLDMIHCRSAAAMIPERILESLIAYRDDYRPTGGFLRAVLENNLSEALGRADDENRLGIFYIVSWVYNEMPISAWGSKEKVKAWLQAGNEIWQREVYHAGRSKTGCGLPF